MKSAREKTCGSSAGILLYENDRLFVLLYLITAGCHRGQKQISYQWMQC